MKFAHPTAATVPHIEQPRNRREFLTRSGAGFGALALSSLFDPRTALASAVGGTSGNSLSLLAPKAGHFAARAKSVIFLFMEGGPSHIDLFDPKPELNRLAGKPLPPSFGNVITAMGEYGAPLLECKRTFKRHGKSGTWVSDWLPNIATCVDDMAVIRSCTTDGINHAGGVCQMNTGSMFEGRPSLGAWVSYGLGSENQNLPAFVVMQDNAATVVGGPKNWGAGFMPAVYQGQRMDAGPEPIANLSAPPSAAGGRRERVLDLIARQNRKHQTRHPHDSILEARIAGYELAYRMQAEAPEAVDLGKESAETKTLYGMDDKTTEGFGRQCLLARRMVERGVRFVQLYSGAGSKWDAHSGLDENHSKLCASTDKPIAGLLKDLKRRGLLQDTLVVWGGEFGRTPMSEKGNGRDHNPYGFTMWMAGGGVQGGQTIGSTDEIGLRAVENSLHVHDLHATILWLMGVDHRRLTYLHKGRPERATMNEGVPYKKIAG